MAASRSKPARRSPGDTLLPGLPRAYVPRERLWSRLDAASEGAVTMVIAPGGAGKTLGVAGWLRSRGYAEASTWLVADESWDAQRLGAVLDRRDPQGQAPLVVVDDAHRLPLDTVRDIDARLDRDPGSMRLVLVSRWDLPLTRLAPELLGHLSILRGDLLRLDHAESAALVEAHAHTAAASVAEDIALRSQGWCAAVVLAARTVGASPDPVAAARQYAAGHSAADRMANEVFATLRPRERHLLLCVSHEPVVTPGLAVHLTRDPDAGEVLADLELTGLLVTRAAVVAEAAADGLEDEEGQDRYTIHPLLTEIVRRRVASGGVDVMRAVATVQRAVRIDAARGDTEHALRRLVSMGDYPGAVSLLATEGPALLLRGHGDLPAALMSNERSTLEQSPEAWLALALDRWFAGDIGRARHWLDRLIETPPTDVDNVDLQVACARLMRARLGLEPLAEALDHGDRVYAVSTPNGDPLLPILLWELGSSHSWTGDLDRAAELHLHGAHLARNLGLPRLQAPMLSSLALVEYARGHSLGANEVAAEAARIIAEHGLDLRYTVGRLELVGGLTAADALPTQPAAWASTQAAWLHDADLFTGFWAQLLRARLALAGGSVLSAERILAEPLPMPMPPHLRLVGSVERALMATLARDAATLQATADELQDQGERAEAAFARALRADVLEDPRRAAVLAREAAAHGTCRQPHTRALAGVLLAQLLDATGDRRGAHAALADAIALTEVRRDPVPFFDWSWHGTRIATLLERHLADQPSEWGREVLTLIAEVPGLVAAFGPEPAAGEPVEAGAPTPVLSPRERDVLFELARGATYADIAANLFVSENTVKTHVSSLYAKLSVNRRSAALAAARALRLL